MSKLQKMFFGAALITMYSAAIPVFANKVGGEGDASFLEQYHDFFHIFLEIIGITAAIVTTIILWQLKKTTKGGLLAESFKFFNIGILFSIFSLLIHPDYFIIFKIDLTMTMKMVMQLIERTTLYFSLLFLLISAYKIKKAFTI